MRLNIKLKHPSRINFRIDVRLNKGLIAYNLDRYEYTFCFLPCLFSYNVFKGVENKQKKHQEWQKRMRLSFSWLFWDYEFLYTKAFKL